MLREQISDPAAGPVVKRAAVAVLASLVADLEPVGQVAAAQVNSFDRNRQCIKW